MKMETVVSATKSGIIARVVLKTGFMVAQDDLVIEIVSNA